MKKLSLTVFLLFSLTASVFAQPVDIPAGSKCMACGMAVDPKSVYSAEMFGKDGQMMAFCDIGDMLSTYKDLAEKPQKVFVKDINSGNWISAYDAFFVKSDKFITPMGWGIAAFKSKEEALKAGEPMTLEKALEAVSQKPMKPMKHKTMH